MKEREKKKFEGEGNFEAIGVIYLFFLHKWGLAYCIFLLKLCAKGSKERKKKERTSPRKKRKVQKKKKVGENDITMAVTMAWLLRVQILWTFWREMKTFKKIWKLFFWGVFEIREKKKERKKEKNRNTFLKKEIFFFHFLILPEQASHWDSKTRLKYV